MRGKVMCCKCWTLFSTARWREEGVLGCSVNNGKKHYACKPCRDAGFDVLKHAVILTGLCAEPKEAA
jgi:hypothetical protein